MVQFGVSNVKTSGVRRRKQRAGRSKRSANAVAVGEFAGDAYALAERAMRGVRAITKLVNIEEKANDGSTSFTLSTAGTVTYLSAIAQGSDYTNRIGDSIKCHSVELIVQVVASAALTTNDGVRVLLFRDLENPGSAPAVTDVLSTANPLGLENWLNRARFKVLFDEVFDISNTANPLVSRLVHLPVDRHIKYRGTGATAASAAEGTMWLVSICGNGTNPSGVNLFWRTRYTDD